MIPADLYWSCTRQVNQPGPIQIFSKVTLQSQVGTARSPQKNNKMIRSFPPECRKIHIWVVVMLVRLLGWRLAINAAARHVVTNTMSGNVVDAQQ